MGSSYLLVVSNLENYINIYGKLDKNNCFSGRIWQDWGNTAWAHATGFGSIGLKAMLWSTFQ